MFAPVVFLALGGGPAAVAVPNHHLAAGLGHDDFAVREAAQAELAGRWPGSARTLALYLSSDNPEVYRRAVLAAHGGRLRQRAAALAGLDAAFPSVGAYPFVDSLWYDPVRRVYAPQTPFEAACQAAYRTYPYAPETDCPYRRGDDPRGPLPAFTPYRAGTRRLAREWVLDRACPVWVLRLIFGVLHQRDLAFLRAGTAPAALAL